jgi:hypothetical protein
MDADLKAIVDAVKPTLTTDRFKYDDEAIADVVRIVREAVAQRGVGLA